MRSFASATQSLCHEGVEPSADQDVLLNHSHEAQHRSVEKAHMAFA